MCGMFDEVGYSSLYHVHQKLDWAETNHVTYRTPTKKNHHLDHFFGSSMFVSQMKEYEILDVDEAVLSDHSPIILTLN